MDYYSVPRRLLRGARQLVYPRRCPFCDQVLGSVPTCPDCAAELEERAGSGHAGWMLPSIIWADWPVRRRPSGMRAVYGGAFYTPNTMLHRGQQWKWASGWQS